MPFMLSKDERVGQSTCLKCSDQVLNIRGRFRPRALQNLGVTVLQAESVFMRTQSEVQEQVHQ
jgi:hypothetical protein